MYFATRHPPARLWEKALVHLWKRKWTDGRIALALRDLTDDAIVELTRRPLAAGKTVALLTDFTPGGGGRPWTAAAVKRYRRRHGLPGNRDDDECNRRRADAHMRRRHARITALGWGHLLPANGDMPVRAAHALTLLRDHGPLTRAGLALLMGRKNLFSHDKDLLAFLRRRGLVARVDAVPATTRPFVVHHLTEAALACLSQVG